MGELGDTETKPAPLLQHRAPLVIGAFTTQVVHLVESGGFGISPEGLEDERQVEDPHVVLCPGSHRGEGLWDVKWRMHPTLLERPGPTHWGIPEPGGRVAARPPVAPPPRPAPSMRPAALANGARCCFGENTFWSLLSKPSQLTPTVEKMCQDKWKISS